ncbi:MAG: hydrogenase 3 maturation endopeptidase HyCI [candidate division WOR-3 bacterium]
MARLLREGRETAEGETGQLSQTAVVVGVGNRLRGDDAVGCLVVEALKGRTDAALFDAETAPENYIEPVAKLNPARILLIDACDFGGRPGEYRLFGRDEIERLAMGLVSTHALPLTMTAQLLGQRTRADVWLLGVQPERVDFGAGMSRAVAKAMPAIVEFVREWLCPEQTGASLR